MLNLHTCSLLLLLLPLADLLSGPLMAFSQPDCNGVCVVGVLGYGFGVDVFMVVWYPRPVARATVSAPPYRWSVP